ncbi:MAG: Rpp14/Pop5 family protein [Thermoproteota archaeon]|nr:Rpp14/Pop5 family protein [Thermoproteota archaeon]
MTLAKKKFRYACIYLHKYENSLMFSDFISDLNMRLIGLYGSIDYHKSGIRIVNVNSMPPKFVIIKCRLEYINNVLLAINFINYPLLILPVSGTIKQLKKRIQEFLIYKDFLMDS